MQTAPFINSENAKLLAKKSWDARRAKKQAAQEIEQASNQPSKPLQKASDDYTASRLVRVRKQLNMLDKMLEEESSAQAIDKLASAIAKLSELERTLAGRPLPGSFRPVQSRGPRHASGSSTGPLDVESD